MTEETITIRRQADRAKAARWAGGVPVGTRIVFKAPVRSLPQNEMMWKLLDELSKKLPWHGVKLSKEDYKDLLSASLQKELRTVPNVEGNGFVILGMRTSKMSTPQMTDFIEYILAFAARHGVALDQAA